jgi:hypothetical protein
MALSLGVEGVSYLQPGQWEGFVSYRWLNAERGFIGNHEDPTYESTVGARLDIHSVDLAATYALTHRYSLSLTMPFVHGTLSSLGAHSDGMRHTMSAGGLGDLRLLVNAWVFHPDRHAKGNLSFGTGVKAPTGDHAATDYSYTPTGRVLRPVDIGIQPGDGGWGIMLETQGFRELSKNLYGYVAGFYLINPREKNGTETTRPQFGAIRINSVPDQYLGRVGLSYALWPEKGLSVSVGGRIDGMPVRDLIGGGDDGFRRPGYSIYVDPGLSWSWGKSHFNLSAPVAVERNRERSVLDMQQGKHGPGAFADFLILASFARRF